MSAKPSHKILFLAFIASCGAATASAAAHVEDYSVRQVRSPDLQIPRRMGTMSHAGSNIDIVPLRLAEESGIMARSKDNSLNFRDKFRTLAKIFPTDPISSGPVTESTPPGRLSVRLLTKETKYLVVEEVDDDGRSEMKQMALPDYNDSEEKREDEERRREQRMQFVSAGMAAGAVPRRARDRGSDGAEWTKDSGGRC